MLLIGKPSINGPFSMAMLNNQRVYIYIPALPQEKKLSHIQRQNELDLAQVHEHPHLLRQATIAP